MGLVRVGTGYTHARFAFHPDTRLGEAGSEPFRDVREVRLSAQLLTPLSETWSSLALGAVASAFEAGADLDDALSGVAVLGVMRRRSARLSAGVGVLLLHPLGKRAATVLPFFLVDWQMMHRLTLRTRQDITLTYLLDPRRRLSIAAVGSFFDRRRFRLDERGVFRAASPRSGVLGQGDCIAVHAELVVGDVEGIATLAFLLEPRPPGFLEEEAPERLAEGSKRLRVGITRRLVYLRELFALDGIELLLEPERGRLLASLVLPIPFAQRPIPGEACDAGGTPQRLFLVRRRLQGNPVAAGNNQRKAS